ncbi:MAG: LAGLIDADG family homing endonuclease [Candidatus Woesearchaeota archaeon]
MHKDLPELIGIIIGDGNLSNVQKHYRIGFTGDPVNDKEYFDYVKVLIKKVWKKSVRIFLGGRGLRIVVNSKTSFTEVTQQYGLPIGEGKCEKVVIPESIANDWNLVRHAIRGLVDTDGSIFVADKRGSPKYPSIEITTCSIRLAEQLRRILLSRGFRVANIWCDRPRTPNSRPSYKVPLNGRANVIKWLQEIGFSNPIKRRKAEAAVS